LFILLLGDLYDCAVGFGSEEPVAAAKTGAFKGVGNGIDDGLMVGGGKGDEAGTSAAEGNGRCPSIISRLCEEEEKELDLTARLFLHLTGKINPYS
jgi:hypothetical protein